MEDGKKVSLHNFSDEKFLLVARCTLKRAFKNAFKVGTVNFTNSLLLPSTVKKVCTGSKKQPRDLSNARQKSR